MTNGKLELGVIFEYIGFKVISKVNVGRYSYWLNTRGRDNGQCARVMRSAFACTALVAQGDHLCNIGACDE